MLGFGATGQFAIGQDAVTIPEIILADKWFIALSEPVRFKQGLSAVQQQFFIPSPIPIVSFSWFGALSEPKRDKPRNPAALTPDLFFHPAPSPFVATGWYSWLSEPVRIKSGLRPEQQQSLAYQFFLPSPTTLIEGWYTWLSEPKRFLKGLPAHLQSDYTAHPRVLPNSNVTIVINALENDQDKYTIAISVVKSNPTATAKVSVTEIISKIGGTGGSATSVTEH